MKRGRPLPALERSVEENNRLADWTRRHKTSQALALRSRIILACAQEAANGEVARRLRVTKQTVGKWRGWFVMRRLDGLLDELRPGAARQIGDEQVEAVIARTLHEKPAQALDRTQPVLPDAGHAGAPDARLMRHGITTLFAALDIATGKVIGQLPCTTAAANS